MKAKTVDGKEIIAGMELWYPWSDGNVSCEVLTDEGNTEQARFWIARHWYGSRENAERAAKEKMAKNAN